MKVAILCVRAGPDQAGGAERFFDGLVQAVCRYGHDASIVDVIGDESTFDAIEETYLRCYDLDVAAFDAVISTKAPTYLVRHANHLCYLVHTMRVFYDMFEQTFPHAGKVLHDQRRRIVRLDTLALSAPRTRRVFAIGNEVAARLRSANGIEAEVLHPPLGFDAFHPGPFGDYIFLPGRLHRWKRVDLAIEAMRLVRSPVRLVIAGGGEDEASLRRLAADMPNVAFAGRVSDAELVELYANALAVAFVPQREDYGYVTLEAFRSGKPVVTCVDSGESTVLVEPGRSGLVVDPLPAALAREFDALHADPAGCEQMGRVGAARVDAIRWDRVVPTLMNVLTSGQGR